MNAAVLVVTLGAMFLIGEVLARRLVSPAPVAAPSPPDPELAGLPELRTMFDLMRPNTRGVFKRTLFRTNSQGVRGPEYSVPKPAGVVRIVIIGDSFTMGSGVAEEDAYPARLEALLNAASGGETFEVANLGVGGFNLQHSLGRLRRIGLAYQPDLLIYGWTSNDIEGPHYRQPHEREPPAVASDSASYLVRWLVPRWRSLRDVFFPGPGSYVYELDENYFRNPPAWNAFTADLQRFGAIVRGRGVCGIVLLHTMLYALERFHPFQRHYEAVADAAAQQGLTAVPTLAAFTGRSASTLWIGRYDSHPNAEGHEILANVLFESVAHLPASCGIAGSLRGGG